MPPAPLWKRLRETRLVQVLVVYLAGAWVAIQAMALFASAFEWPNWVMRGTIVFLAAVLLVTMGLVWARTRGRAVEGAALPRSRPVLAGVLALSLLVMGAALWFVVRDRGRSLVPAVAEASAAPGIAILPFSVNDEELSRWREGMVDLLATNLDGAAGLRAIDSRTVLARWRERVGQAGDADLQSSLDVARLSGGRYALVGSVVSSGSDMRILTDVYDLTDGAQLGQEMVQGSPDSIFSLVDRLSIAVLGRILTRHEGQAGGVDLASITTTSVPALKAFLEAEELTRRSDFPAALPAYERAVEADSTFALAAFRASHAYGWIEGLGSNRAAELLDRAQRFADRLPVRGRDALAADIALFQARPAASRLAAGLTEQYPDDPFAWFLLGEVRFHHAFQTMPSRAEKERPFLHALGLDPSYTPAYLHLLDLAFQYADSARVAELLPRFEQLAEGTDEALRYHIARDLAWGTSDEREAAMAGLVGLPVMVAGRTLALLNHPRFYDIQEPVGRALMERPDAPPGALTPHWGWMFIVRGQVERGVEVALSPEMPPDARAQMLGMLTEYQTPLPEAKVDSALAADAARGPGPAGFTRAQRAIRAGRPAEAEAAIAGMTRAAEAMRASGDSLMAARVAAVASILRGHLAMERGDTETAQSLLEEAFRETGIPIAAMWLARLHADQGRPREALRYLETFGPNPWVGLQAGALYEEVGERDKALEAYGWVTLAWDQADPELQPEVGRAREAIARLRGLQRG